MACSIQEPPTRSEASFTRWCLVLLWLLCVRRWFWNSKLRLRAADKRRELGKKSRKRGKLALSPFRLEDQHSCWANGRSTVQRSMQFPRFNEHSDPGSMKLQRGLQTCNHVRNTCHDSA